MKAKLTKLSAALLRAGIAGGALAVVAAAPAMAAVQNSTVQAGFGNAVGGEMLFTVWDQDRELSYTRDLGTNWVEVPDLATVAGMQGEILAYDADALLTTFLADSAAAGSLDSIVWSVVVAQSVGFDIIYTTVEIGNTPVHPGGNLANQTTKYDTWIGGLNGLPTHSTTPLADGDGSSIAIPSDQAYYGSAMATWPWQELAGLGEDLAFWAATSFDTSTADYEQFTGELGPALWSLDADSGQLVFAAPVPEAETWALLGLGLMGLGFYARRRTGTQAQPLALA